MLGPGASTALLLRQIGTNATVFETNCGAIVDSVSGPVFLLYSLGRKGKVRPRESGTDSLVAPPAPASGQRCREGWGGLKVY